VHNIVGMISKWENGTTWNKLHPSATLSSTNPTQTDMGLNPGQQSSRLATNHLRHDKASFS